MRKILGIAATVMLVTFVAISLSTRTAKAQSATVFIDCPDTVDVGTFQAKVNISDVTGLYGWEFKLYYNKTLLNFTSYNVTNHFLESGGNTFQVDKSDNNYNSTHGLVWLADSLLGAPSGVNGSGTLVTITFEALDVGFAELTFEDQLPDEGKNVKLGDQSATPIPNIAIDKSFNIIPEFTLPMLLIAMLAVTSAAILLTKKSKILKW